MGDGPNPFRMPTDEEVFALRDEEQHRKQLQREKVAGQHIWEKGVPAIAGGVRDYSSHRSDQAQAQAILQTKVNLVAAATRDRRKEKENMADFIAKKREMFLVQMSLDTKREEIRKLEEKAQMKEEALKKSEQMLEEDAIRFDTFLKENDKKAHEAIKKAERETKLKTDKVQEIKKLNQQIQMVQSDMSKHKEALEDCLKYKDFLDSLTPPEWFEEKKRIKAENQEKRRQGRIAKRRAAWEADCKRVRDEWERAQAAEAEAHAKSGKRKKANRGGAADAAAATGPRMPPAPHFDNEPLTESGEELPMYFQHPQQLLDIFTALEEQNLFLIQNSQETEQALEELKQTFQDTKAKMDHKTEALKLNIDELSQQIVFEENKASQLRKRILVCVCVCAREASERARRSASESERASWEPRERFGRCAWVAAHGTASRMKDATPRTRPPREHASSRAIVSRVPIAHSELSGRARVVVCVGGVRRATAKRRRHASTTGAAAWAPPRERQGRVSRLSERHIFPPRTHPDARRAGSAARSRDRFRMSMRAGAGARLLRPPRGQERKIAESMRDAMPSPAGRRGT